MRDNDCQFHGKHRYELSLVESCKGCGQVRRRSKTSRAALWLVPTALWTNALLLLALIVG